MATRISGAALVLALSLSAAASAQPAFPSATDCALCHSRIPPPAQSAWRDGPSIAPFALWRGSMMAHAAADPYWSRKVAAEVTEAGAGIEDKCLRCHAPARQYPTRGTSSPMRMSQVTDSDEGVTCSVCHQIAPTGLGTRASFTGEFAINTAAEAFGPHRDPFTMPMRHHTDLTPTYGKHVLEAAFCGSCHTVITHPVGADRNQEFLEQTPFLEWLSADASREDRPCQSCHVPNLRDSHGRELPQFIAHRPPGGAFPPTSPRTPFGMHLFLGGNFQIPRLLATQKPEEREFLHKTADRAIAFLKSALRAEAHAERRADGVLLHVTLENRTGHKLPTGYPSRRLWIHVRATDGQGNTIFDSGNWDERTGELTAGEQFRPHRRTIDDPAQVMIYEAEYLDVEDRPTLSLARAARYRKDNRILPRGFDESRVYSLGFEPGALSGVGLQDDPDFRPGSDTVTYRIPPAAAIKVQILFQTIKPAHAHAVRLDLDARPAVAQEIELNVP